MTRKDFAKLCIAPILTAIFAISFFILIDQLQFPETTAKRDRILSALSDGTISAKNPQLIQAFGTCHERAQADEEFIAAIVKLSKSASLVILSFVAIQLIFSISIYQRYRDKL